MSSVKLGSLFTRVGGGVIIGWAGSTGAGAAKTAGRSARGSRAARNRAMAEWDCVVCDVVMTAFGKVATMMSVPSGDSS